MKFIHTGDIHWGMCPDANKPWGKERAQAIKDTFRIIIEKTKEMDVDCLFISGDLFHRQPLMKDLKEVCSQSQRAVLRLFRDLSGPVKRLYSISWLSGLTRTSWFTLAAASVETR